MNNSSSSDNLPPGGGSNGMGRPGGGSNGMGPPGGGGMGPTPDFGSVPITSIQRNLAFYGYIFLFLFGFFGHAASTSIFLRRSLRSISTSCLFLCMAGSDTIYLSMCIYDFLFLGLGVPTTNIDLMNSLCRFRSFVQYFSMCCSAWLLLSITIDRWLRVQFPFRVKELCTIKRALIGAFIIFMCSIALNSHLQLPSLGVVPGAIACAPGIKIFIGLRGQQKRQLKQGRCRTFLDRQMLIIMLTSIVLFFITQIPLSLFSILMIYVLRNELALQQLLQLNTITTFVASINYAGPANRLSMSMNVTCMIGAVFHIVTVQLDNNIDHLWTIKLVLCDGRSNELFGVL
ncbi:unnamed protein product [Rotaria socialis]